MKAVLRDIASIQMGYSFRNRIESMDSGAVAVIQMKDLSDENRVDCSALTCVDMESPKEHHLARLGDLIFRSRGLTSTSAILSDDPGVAMVAAPLLRIRVLSPALLPEYLNWYISQPPAQAFLTSHAKGTAQKMISKETLEELEVDLPSLELQKTIVTLASLGDKEQQLMKKLAARRHQLISTRLIRLAQGE